LGKVREVNGVSLRMDKSWTVLASIETGDGHRCVDLFRRLDGTFGYEEFRRDPEDQGVDTGALRFRIQLCDPRGRSRSRHEGGSVDA
jgi:hypothetical protein